MRHPLLQPRAGHGPRRDRAAADGERWRRSRRPRRSPWHAASSPSSSRTRPGSSSTTSCSRTSTTRCGSSSRGWLSRDDIDAAMRGGCNFPIGPARRCSTWSGLDTSLAILDALYDGVPRPALRGGAAPPPPGRPRAAWAARAAEGFYDYRKESVRGPALGDAHLLGALDAHRATNALYRTNLAKGQTGLSVAFDLPTQMGYDPDAPEAARRGRARSACPSPTSVTCASCSTASTSQP